MRRIVFVWGGGSEGVGGSGGGGWGGGGGGKWARVRILCYDFDDV